MVAEAIGLRAQVESCDFVVTGEGKRQALEAWLAGASLPAQWIQPHAGVDLFTDVAINSCG